MKFIQNAVPVFAGWLFCWTYRHSLSGEGNWLLLFQQPGVAVCSSIVPPAQIQHSGPSAVVVLMHGVPGLDNFIHIKSVFSHMIRLQTWFSRSYQKGISFLLSLMFADLCEIFINAFRTFGWVTGKHSSKFSWLLVTWTSNILYEIVTSCFLPHWCLLESVSCKICG